MTEQKSPQQDSQKAASVDPFAMVNEIKTQGPAPVHLWDPPFCGDINMRITRDGTWFHEGSPIRRPAMVRLFSSILKKEGGRHYLVTPVEKVGIEVEDCPFIVVDMEVEGQGREQVLGFVTNTGERFTLDREHTLRVDEDDRSGEPHPVVHVRSDLFALVKRSVFYRLVELAEQRQSDKRREMGVWSSGEFFVLGRVD